MSDHVQFLNDDALKKENSSDNEQSDKSDENQIPSLNHRILSLYESGISNGKVSLNVLFNENYVEPYVSKITLEDIATAIIRGGWSETIGLDDSESYRIVSEYCESIIKSQLTDEKFRNKRKTRSLLKALSRNITSQVSANTILDDIKKNRGVSLSSNTFYDYMNALRSLSIVENLHAWTPKLISKVPIRISDTLHFSDPSIPAYFLKLNSQDLLFNPDLFSKLFESLVIRDLRIYAEKINGKVYHYRDKNGLEVDAIIVLDDGRWGAIEVRLTDNWADEAVKNLNSLRNKVDSEVMGSMSFSAVIVATGTAYTRKDGVHVIPITCLRN